MEDVGRCGLHISVNCPDLHTGRRIGAVYLPTGILATSYFTPPRSMPRERYVRPSLRLRSTPRRHKAWVWSARRFPFSTGWEDWASGAGSRLTPGR